MSELSSPIAKLDRMLIRQKAGWRLHHQAYLWPRRSRASALSSLPASLLLPRRRRSGASSGSSTAHSGDDGSSSPSSLRRSSSCSSGLEGEEIWPPSSSSSSPLLIPRTRKGSIGAADNSTPSSTAPSYGPLSSRKRKSAGCAGLDGAETQSISLFSGPSTRWGRRSSSSSDPALEECRARLPSKRGRRSSGGVGSGDGLGGYNAIFTSADARRVNGRAISTDEEINECSEAGARSQTCCQTRSDSPVRARKDTRSGDPKSVESSCELSCYSSHKGSSSSNNNNNKNNNNNNNHISHCSNLHTSSIKDTIRDSDCWDSVARTCSLSTAMGVLCTEKHDRDERCSCGGPPAGSPLQATIPHFPPSPPINSDGQDSASHAQPRKRSADALFSGSPAIRRRAQRSPSAGSISLEVDHAVTSESFSVDITDIVGQNGFKLDVGRNGVKPGPGYQNGTKPLCCFTLGGKCKKCPARPLGAVASTPSLSTASRLQVTASAAVSTSAHGCRRRSNSHGNAGIGRAVVLACSVETSAFILGSTSQPASCEPNRAKHRHHSSSLSSLAASASPQHQLHQSTQGPKSFNVGSMNNSDNTSGSSDKDDAGGVATAASSSKCISASANATVLSLRHRSHSSNSAHRSQSQPASPQSSTSSSSRSKSAALSASSSSPSLSTLVAEPSSPGQPSTAQCKWRGCSCELDASDLLEHIRKHVESQIEKKAYACLWVDCKVFNKPSWSCSWLERHIVTHSGHRPFKCILDNCGQRFHSQAVLERHVNGHFTVNSQNGARSGRSRDEANHRVLHRRKRQLKRHYAQTVKINDFFDEQTMTVVRHELQSLAEYTQLDITGIALHTTFQGLIVGRRSTKSGCKHSLMEFTPSDVLENKWVLEEEAQQMTEISIPFAKLPADTVTNLHSNLYRRHRFRKHRRK